MTVYLLWNGCGELMGVFSTEEKARAMIPEKPIGLWIVYPEKVK